MRRALMLLRHLLPLVASFARDRRRWLVLGGPMERSRAFHARRAGRLADTLGRMGPTFIKLSQLFAGRRDLVPSPYIEAIGTLTDRVPAVPWSAVRAALAESYGRPPEQVFDWISAEPLAAASLGQVHRATVQGRDVVVKVLRPGVETTIAADLRAARALLRWLAPRLHPPHLRGLHSVLDEFERRVAEEMDFRAEARFAETIRANFAGNDRVRVPEVIPGFVRQRALVLEYMAGTRIDRLDDDLAGGRLDPEPVLRTVMELYVQMMLVDGLFHADPHPGNILVDAAGRVVLLDFGMVVPVPPETRRALVGTVFAAIRKDVDGVVDGFYALGLIEPGASRDVIHTLAAQLILLADERTTAQERIERVTRLADEVVGTLYDFPVQLPADMVYFARTAALIEGLGVRYDPRFNPVGFATPIALRFRGAILRSLGDEPPLPETIPGVLGALAGRAAKWARRMGRVAEVAWRTRSEAS
ncbi:MAG: AarF/ABC1/UbiB kinase family protein [Gemmatimonadetes bacterium]|nr:AarF/ABC1/UbiB kinase family protein [Gemmatimonadota bacterium]MCA9763272.1 AarF/ABC1/UbiB kinase family protein [Gemmatimonadota bacterium]MCB9504650.1 AarF/ABC1/UbiB kinase family protein [Gemmatimonadales bacterium]HPF61088.1 AarF/UbiB family protein [Gemmatimonadales bacterium]HRX17832.1 AarF/UbiB family protein [Gemmatimonadales bacterium]